MDRIEELPRDQLGLPPYDFVGLLNDYSGNPIRIVFRDGGSSGGIVGVINNQYDTNGMLISCQRVVM
jgi:hypothetical protein